jgi:hypothetical protein
MSALRRFRRRARARGFSHVSTTLEAAAIMGWFAIAVISEKKLDDAVTNRRAVEASAQDSAHASGGACKNEAIDNAVGEAKPKANVQIKSDAKLGLEDSKLPQTQQLGFSHAQAFPAQKAPIKVASVVSRSKNEEAENGGGNFVGERQVSCQESPPRENASNAAQAIEPLRQKLWDKNLKGYR